MYPLIKSIINGLTLDVIDDTRIDITSIDSYNKLLNHHDLKVIFEQAQLRDSFEFSRTIRHTLRILIVYFSLLNRKKLLQNKLDDGKLGELRRLIEAVNKENERILPTIFLLHDIGKPFNQKFHAQESVKIIKQFNLLDPKEFSQREIIMIIKVIEYHLLLGTINNGESSFYALKHLRADPEFKIILDDHGYLQRFLDLLVVFALLDIFGYPYSEITPNMVNQFMDFRSNFSDLLSITDDKKFNEEIKELSFNNIDWRLANCIRIFQNINTKPLYTENFFRQKIWDAIEDYENVKIEKDNWNEYKNSKFAFIPRLQIIYGLPVLMRLAIGPFYKRGWRIDKDTKISTRLIEFWRLLNDKTANLLENNQASDQPITVLLKGIPHWSKFDKATFKFLEKEVIETVINEAVLDLNPENKQYRLILDFEKIKKNDG